VTAGIDAECMSNQTERPLTPLVIAFVLVYAVALLICGILVDGTIALAFVTVGVMAVVATLIGVELFRNLDE